MTSRNQPSENRPRSGQTAGIAGRQTSACGTMHALRAGAPPCRTTRSLAFSTWAAIRRRRQAAPMTVRLLYDSQGSDDARRVRRHDGQRQDRLCLALLEEAGDRRHPGDLHRPQGRPRQPAAHVSRPAPARLPTVGRRGRSAAQGPHRRSSYAAQTGRAVEEGTRRLGPGRRSASASFATPSIWRSTRRFAARLPISVLRSFAAPPAELSRTRDALRERIAHRLRRCWRCWASTPIRSRAASTSCCPTFSSAHGARATASTWPALIRQVQKPPFEKRRRRRSRDVLSGEGTPGAGDGDQ